MKIIKVNPIKHIFIIGLGGIGGWYFAWLGKYLKSIGKEQNFKFHLYDDDIVEERNCVRQNFIHMDIGKFKVEVMKERYGNAYNLIVNASTSKAKIYTPGSDALIVGCVDNLETRQDLATKTCYGAIYIDIGNETEHGQVCVSTYNGPTIYEVFPNLKNLSSTTSIAENSCINAPQQTTIINQMGAMRALQLTSRIIERNELLVKRIDFLLNGQDSYQYFE